MHRNPFDGHVGEGNVDPEATTRMSYRAFRAVILSQCRDDWTPCYSVEETRPTFTIQRKKIHAFRRHLVFHAANWIVDGRYPRQHIDRALRLDPTFTLTLSRRERWLRVWIKWVPSAHTVMRLACPWLRHAKTFEGRWFIIRERLPHGLATNRIHFERALDYGLMHWGDFPSEKAMDEFSRIHFDWIRAARHLGLDDLQSILAWVPRRGKADSASLFWILVREGAITEACERAWVDRWHQPSSCSGPKLDERRIGEVVSVLRRYGVERERIVEALCTLPHHELKPAILAQTLALLGERGISDYGRLLSGLGTCLADVAAERWLLLLDQFSVRDTAALLQFDRLLRSHEPCSVELGHALIAHGASAADLALCQPVLLAAGAFPDQQAPIAALSVLMSLPHSFQFAQVAQASAYLSHPDALLAFLAVLDRYGFGGAESVLCFQPCYRKVQAPQLACLLALTHALGTRPVITEVVEWIEYANADHIEAYEYLAGALRIRTVRQLRQVAKLAFLSVEPLRHLVERHGLRTRKVLTDWFYDHDRAFGIKSVKWWGTSLDPVNQVLFDDAFTRQAFNYWESNRQCVYDVVCARVTSVLGNFPVKGSASERSDYWAAEEVLTGEMRAALLPTLPIMLEATSGILLHSVAASGWSDMQSLTRQLAQLEPLLDHLLNGQGPVASTITQLEVEAIALVYRTPPATVRALWQQLVGYETDIAQWGAASRYAMNWRRAKVTRRSPLDRAGLVGVSTAVQSAAAFRETYRTDMARACARLATAVAGESGDLPDLAPRLSVLLAIAADDPAAAAWMKTVPVSLTEQDDVAYEQVLIMQTFFGIGLADALQATGESFCRELGPRHATLLAKQLGAPATADLDPQSALQRLLGQMTRDLGGRFNEWALYELGKFGAEAAGDHSVEMNAIVTKHPAAFFSKEAAKLCTANNVLMWQEARQAHLVVFDAAHRSFQGMALLYREILPRVHPSKPVL